MERTSPRAYARRVERTHHVEIIATRYRTARDIPHAPWYLRWSAPSYLLQERTHHEGWLWAMSRIPCLGARLRAQHRDRHRIVQRLLEAFDIADAGRPPGDHLPQRLYGARAADIHPILHTVTLGEPACEHLLVGVEPNPITRARGSLVAMPTA